MQWNTAGSEIEILVESEAETDRLGRILAEVLQPNTVIGLIGPLGAGKTRLVRAVAAGLDVDPDLVTSPTFVLIHEYDGRLPVFHFDTYRLASAEEFEALGTSDYWSAGGVCLVEWADRVAGRLPASTWFLTIEPVDEVSRRIRGSFPADVAIAGQLAGRLSAAPS